ncbi:MAG: LTA synthase family protein [Eubacteriales bacterium]|nr:LTA synthase family protein [Eubacteriales bacterium]
MKHILSRKLHAKQICLLTLLAFNACFALMQKNILGSTRNLMLALASAVFAAIMVTLTPCRFKRCLQVALFLLTPAMAFIIVQEYAQYAILTILPMFVTPAGLGNLFLYALILVFLYLVLNRMKYSSSILLLTASIFGAANYFVMMFRTSPIMAPDFASFGTAMDVAGGYVYTLDQSATQAVIYTLSAMCLYLGFDEKKGLRPRFRLGVLAVFLGSFSVFYTQFRTGKYMEKNNLRLNIWAPEKNYASNGSLLSLLISYTYYKVDVPEGYSANKAAEIASRYESDSSADGKHPNVIAVMNEAFSDLEVQAPLKTSEDYMPFIHGLTENVRKGNLYVSVRGTGTATSEFEFLTGNSMAFLPYRCIAYNNYLNAPMVSLTTTLREQGYGANIAVHPGNRDAWNRDVAYPNLGFEVFYDYTYLTDCELIHGHISDKSDYDFLIRQYEEFRSQSDLPFYLFNVTIQNHSPYDAPDRQVEEKIRLLNTNVWKNGTSQYINLIKTSDEQFQRLTEYFEAVDEPTVILLFGDHQPSLSAKKKYCHAGDSLENTVNQHTVPYVIWANYDIGTDTQHDMSVNYLSAWLLDTIQSPMTGYQKFLLDMSQEVPLLTQFAYRGDDGILHEAGEESAYTSVLNEYAILQYNNIFDSKNHLDTFFHLE